MDPWFLKIMMNLNRLSLQQVEGPLPVREKKVLNGRHVHAGQGLAV